MSPPTILLAASAGVILSRPSSAVFISHIVEFAAAFCARRRRATERGTLRGDCHRFFFAALDARHSYSRLQDIHGAFALHQVNTLNSTICLSLDASIEPCALAGATTGAGEARTRSNVRLFSCLSACPCTPPPRHHSCAYHASFVMNY